MQKPYLIGLTGASGSGKTTFLESLLQNFSENEICLVSQDNYYKPRKNQKEDDQGIKNFDLPSSINGDEFAQDVCQLVAGKVVTREEYTFNNASKKPKILTFKPCPVILLEGLFVMHNPKIAKLIDLKVFFHAKETTALSRRIRRDKIERGYPLDDVLYRYENHVQPSFERYIKPFREQADIIINNNRDFSNGLAVLSGFLRQKLAK